jgi:ComF family protein
LSRRFLGALDSVLDLVYPPMCLHCEDPVASGAPLCLFCQSLLELIDPKERCPRCFTHEFVPGQVACPKCWDEEVAFSAVGSAFDYIGPAVRLVCLFKYSKMHGLAKGLAGYLVAQYLRLGWPLPDLIVPAPIQPSHWWDRGYNQSDLLAQEVGRILGVPVESLLRKQEGDWSQAGLSKRQRTQLSSESIWIADREAVQDKVVLLIDDVLTTGTTLRRCSDALYEGFPTELYALTVCRAI